MKGIVIHPPKGLPVRPTTDRAKESLFNILTVNFNLEECTVMELFSGTGNMAFEFCSRGAARVLAVETNVKCIEFIRQMRAKHGLSMLEVQKKDVYTYLKTHKESFDIIFADPPYAQKELTTIPEIVFSHKMLNPGGWLIIEHESHLEMSDQKGFFEKRVYGQSVFSFFKMPE